MSLTLYASDWDVLGKVLTGIEGTRLISGGKIDIIGTLNGIDNNRYRYSAPRYNYHCRRKYNDCCRRIWVPTTVWKRKWVPTHRECHHGREVIVKGHYVEYEVETGGYWQISCPHQKHYSYYSRCHN